MNMPKVVAGVQRKKKGGYPMVSEQIRPLTPIQAIRAKCLDCTCGSRKDVSLCEITTCELWPFRMGKRPKLGLIVEDKTDTARISNITIESDHQMGCHFHEGMTPLSSEER